MMDLINKILTDYLMVGALLLVASWFTIAGRGVQFRMVGEMFRLLVRSGMADNDRRSGVAPHKGAVSSFQAFALSIAARVGTGNLAGVATAITIGGPGAIFWMWMIAILGAASSFVESTLAQLFKIKDEHSFRGGPAYYIQKGLGKRWWAVTFAVLITLTFGFAFNTVQSNTIANAFNQSFGISPQITGAVLAVLTLLIIFGGIRSIARFAQIVVPFMAIAYLLLAIVLVACNMGSLPGVLCLIFENAFGFGPAVGGSVGTAMAMGIKRGLFSNEAGEGSTPNAAATASVSHPVKQGLVQTLGVYVDTLVVCTATALIILCSGIYDGGYEGIVLTQKAIDFHLGGGSNYGSVFVSVVILFFAFTSIIANYYYGETNVKFIRDNRLVTSAYRLAVGVLVYLGAVMSLDMVWGFADITMALMTLCNLAAISLLGKYAFRLLADYRRQRKQGLDPVYKSSTIPEIAGQTQCWK